MNLKTSKRDLRRKIMNPNYYVQCCIIGCHGNSLLHLVWTKSHLWKTLGGGIQSILKHLYLSIMHSSTVNFNIYIASSLKVKARIPSVDISQPNIYIYIIYFTYYPLGCEISTEGILALTLRLALTFYYYFIRLWRCYDSVQLMILCWSYLNQWHMI